MEMITIEIERLQSCIDKLRDMNPATTKGSEGRIYTYSVDDKLKFVFHPDKKNNTWLLELNNHELL